MRVFLAYTDLNKWYVAGLLNEYEAMFEDGYRLILRCSYVWFQQDYDFIQQNAGQVAVCTCARGAEM